MSTEITDAATARRFPPPAWDDYATEKITGRDMWWGVGKALVHPDNVDDPATYRSRAALAQLFLNAGGDEARGQLSPRLRGFINELAIAFALENASLPALQHLPLVRLTRNEENTRLVIDINYPLLGASGRRDLYELIHEWLTTLGLRPAWIGNGQTVTVDTTTRTITTRYYTPAPGTDPNAEYIGLNYIQDPETGEHLTTEITVAHTGPLPTPPAALADFTHTT